ncbi:MAG: preprotein translocase subunit SecE [Candidatus Shapirobacteria bacterium]|jgi:preprotein translocase subunit SecE
MSKVLQFLREVKAEFHHITWPKKDALLNLTIVVISFSVVVSLILGGFDYLFTNSIGLLGQLKNQPVQVLPTPEIQINLTPVASPSASASPTAKPKK